MMKWHDAVTDWWATALVVALGGPLLLLLVVLVLVFGAAAIAALTVGGLAYAAGAALVGVVQAVCGAVRTAWERVR